MVQGQIYGSILCAAATTKGTQKKFSEALVWGMLKAGVGDFQHGQLALDAVSGAIPKRPIGGQGA